MQKNQAKRKKNVDKSDGNSERAFGKPGRDSEKPRENAPVTAGKSSGISHANLEEAKENATTTVEKLREDSSAITGKARKKTQENKGAVWENNQNSKENPRQSTEKVIDKTQKKNGRENQQYVSRGNAICKRKNRACKKCRADI